MAKDFARFKGEKMGGSLVRRVLVICLCLLIFPLIIHTFILYHESYKEKINDHLHEISVIGSSSEEVFDEWILFYERSLKLIATHVDANVINFKEMTLQLKLSSLFRMVKESDGSFVCVNANDDNRKGMKNLFFDEISTMKAGDSKVFGANDPLTKISQIFVAVVAREGEVYILGKSIMGWINRFSQTYREYFLYWLTFVDHQGNVLATNDPFFTLKGTQIISMKDLTEKKPVLLHSKYKFFILDIPFPNTDFSLYIGFSRMSIQQQTLSYLLKGLLVFSFLVFFVGGGMVWWLTSKMMQPLNALYHLMREVGKGNLKARFVKQKWGFEINQVGIFFNRTVNDLVANMKKVEDERLRIGTYQKELDIAREIQNNLFPKKIPSFPSLHIATKYLPAKVVSGDFYDFFPIGDKLMIVIADAAGKGISASLFSLSVRSLLRSSSMEFATLEEMVFATNQLFCLDTQDTGSFVTAWIGLYDRKTKRLQYTSCGHNPVFFKPVQGEVEELITPGMALGVSPTEKFKVKEMQLQAGDCMLLYTDGLVEAQNFESEFYGKERVFEMVKSFDSLPPPAFLEMLLEDVDRFTRKAEQFDDITLIALQIS